MKEIVDKKKNRGGKMEKKKKRTETHRYGGGNSSFSRCLFDYTWSEAFKDKMKRKIEILLSKENKKANYESLKHFAWMLCCQHILGT